MKLYPLSRNNLNPRILEPLDSLYSEEFVQENYDLNLAEEYTRDVFGRVSRAYRLHSSKPHSVDMALSYSIRCPRCSTHLLKQVGRSLNYYDLGVYKCPVCDKE